LVLTRPLSATQPPLPDETIPARLLDLLVSMDTVPELLQSICQLAVEVVPDCEAAGLTVIDREAPVTVVASDERTRRIELAQYRDGDGPSLRAARFDTDTTVHLDLVEAAESSGQQGDFGFTSSSTVDPASSPVTGASWPQLAVAAGVTAIASMPIPATVDLHAALTLYTGRPHGWLPESLDVADALITYAGDAIAIAYRLRPR
jgi:hypothetical protein